MSPTLLLVAQLGALTRPLKKVTRVDPLNNQHSDNGRVFKSTPPDKPPDGTAPQL
jgi:hypothetical protein